jgi:hypothetical protein
MLIQSACGYALLRNQLQVKVADSSAKSVSWLNFQAGFHTRKRASGGKGFSAQESLNPQDRRKEKTGGARKPKIKIDKQAARIISHSFRVALIILLCPSAFDYE